MLGYARVRALEQDLNHQIGLLRAAGCKLVFQDKMSAKGRPGLSDAINALASEDILVIAEWACVVRSMMDGIQIMVRVHDRGATFKALDLPWLDLTTPIGKKILAFLGRLASEEKKQNAKRTEEGRALARTNGVRFGRKPKLFPTQI